MAQSIAHMDGDSVADLDDGRELHDDDAVEKLFTNDHPVKVEIGELKNILSDEHRFKRGGTITDTDITNIEIETIEKMSPDVKSIFIKIREQLQDPTHPLMRICSKFQEEFIRQVDRQASELRTKADADAQSSCLTVSHQDFMDR